MKIEIHCIAKNGKEEVLDFDGTVKEAIVIMDEILLSKETKAVFLRKAKTNVH